MSDLPVPASGAPHAGSSPSTRLARDSGSVFRTCGRSYWRVLKYHSFFEWIWRAGGEWIWRAGGQNGHREGPAAGCTQAVDTVRTSASRGLGLGFDHKALQIRDGAGRTRGFSSRGTARPIAIPEGPIRQLTAVTTGSLRNQSTGSYQPVDTQDLRPVVLAGSLS